MNENCRNINKFSLSKCGKCDQNNEDINNVFDNMMKLYKEKFDFNDYCVIRKFMERYSQIYNENVCQQIIKTVYELYQNHSESLLWYINSSQNNHIEFNQQWEMDKEMLSKLPTGIIMISLVPFPFDNTQNSVYMNQESANMLGYRSQDDFSCMDICVKIENEIQHFLNAFVNKKECYSMTSEWFCNNMHNMIRSTDNVIIKKDSKGMPIYLIHWIGIDWTLYESNHHPCITLQEEVTTPDILTRKCHDNNNVKNLLPLKFPFDSSFQHQHIKNAIIPFDYNNTTLFNTREEYPSDDWASIKDLNKFFN